ncbi:MAG: adenosylmethionine decarboxylase [Thiotrichales bacterium]|nr:adenosylmethionine decarboxylase [Thiotrichales bacterium]
MSHSENILVTSNNHFEVVEKTTLIDDSWPTHDQAIKDQTLDHFICRDGKVFAGTHLIIDLWGASNLDNLQIMEQALRKAVKEAKATLLHLHLHHFTPNGGISGVAVLAESHISVHSWPERDYAAFDVFMCGDSEPEKAIDVLRDAFQPSEVQVDSLLRGQVVTV